MLAMRSARTWSGSRPSRCARSWSSSLMRGVAVGPVSTPLTVTPSGAMTGATVERDRVQARLVAGPDQEVAALGGEGIRDRCSDAGGRTTDDGPTATNPEVHAAIIGGAGHGPAVRHTCVSNHPQATRDPDAT